MNGVSASHIQCLSQPGTFNAAWEKHSALSRAHCLCRSTDLSKSLPISPDCGWVTAPPSLWIWLILYSWLFRQCGSWACFLLGWSLCSPCYTWSFGWLGPTQPRLCPRTPSLSQIRSLQVTCFESGVPISNVYPEILHLEKKLPLLISTLEMETLKLTKVIFDLTLLTLSLAHFTQHSLASHYGSGRRALGHHSPSLGHCGVQCSVTSAPWWFKVCISETFIWAWD